MAIVERACGEVFTHTREVLDAAFNDQDLDCSNDVIEHWSDSTQVSFKELLTGQELPAV